MSKLIDLTGKKFGRLTVIKRVPKPERVKGRNAFFLCYCDCGNEKIISSLSLKRNVTNSCGCLKKELLSKRRSKHKASYTRLYKIWNGMMARCLNSKVENYKYYGERNIEICKEWLDYLTFAKWARENGYKDNLTIDRINNNGNYEPTNCQWITKSENSRKDHQGEKSNNAKLTQQEVIIIRKIENKIKQKHLASFFNVSRDTIYDILSYRTWKHI